MKEVGIMRENKNMEAFSDLKRLENEWSQIYTLIECWLWEIELKIADSHDITKSDFGFRWE